MARKLSIVIVEVNPRRAKAIVDALSAIGDNELHVVDSSAGLGRNVAELKADVVLIDAGNPTRDMLEELTLATGPLERPVAMFVEKGAGGLARAAVEAGVSAYVVDGLQPERVVPILEAAIARFQEFRRIRAELEETRRALEERKVIDRAKGIMMKKRGIGEDEAYAALRKAAMDQGKRVAEIAAAVVTAAELMP